jgi:hypothetical protein
MSHTQEAVHALGFKGAGDDAVVSWLAHLQDGAFVLGATGLEFINQALADIVGYPEPCSRILALAPCITQWMGELRDTFLGEEWAR